jgi:hypothetical protein
MVRAVGIEPTLLAEPDFESGASTSFTTPARSRPGRGSAQLTGPRRDFNPLAIDTSLCGHPAKAFARSDHLSDPDQISAQFPSFAAIVKLRSSYRQIADSRG